MPTLLLMVAPQAVILTTYGATSDNEFRNTREIPVPGK